jgi:hypothetical protein
MVWYGMVWYGMVWYGMVWYGMVWYGMVWYYIMVCYGIAYKKLKLLVSPFCASFFLLNMHVLSNVIYL